MAFGDLLNKAKDKTQEVSSSVKEKVENTKDSLGNLSKVVEEMISNLNEALPILKEYGFGLIELEIELGVPPDRITTISYGEENPIDPRHCEEAWAKNRRDEFKLIRRK